uniref:Uncharacterized protein n=1 Tax=Arundo donax TaxID=35708 RepID=A0A0A9BA61_ARUDO
MIQSGNDNKESSDHISTHICKCKDICFSLE